MQPEIVEGGHIHLLSLPPHQVFMSLSMLWSCTLKVINSKLRTTLARGKGKNRLLTVDTHCHALKKKARCCSGGETLGQQWPVSAETKSLLWRRKKAKEGAQRLLAMEPFPGREHSGHLRSSSRHSASHQVGRKLHWMPACLLSQPSTFWTQMPQQLLFQVTKGPQRLFPDPGTLASQSPFRVPKQSKGPQVLYLKRLSIPPPPLHSPQPHGLSSPGHRTLP